jgi:hypothetical protein
MNYTFGKNIKYLWQASKNHLVHNACVKVPYVSKKQLSTAALCAATSAGCHHCLPLQSCCWLLPPACCCCTLLHTCCSAACCCTHATSAACCCTHAGCLPSIACRLRLHQCTLLAAAPMLLLLHTAACTPLAPLLPSPLPPPLLLVPRPLIAKKR